MLPWMQLTTASDTVTEAARVSTWLLAEELHLHDNMICQVDPGVSEVCLFFERLICLLTNCIIQLKTRLGSYIDQLRISPTMSTLISMVDRE